MKLTTTEFNTRFKGSLVHIILKGGFQLDGVITNAKFTKDGKGVTGLFVDGFRSDNSNSASQWVESRNILYSLRSIEEIKFEREG